MAEVDRVNQSGPPVGDLVVNNNQILHSDGTVVDGETGAVLHNFNFPAFTWVGVDPTSGDLFALNPGGWIDQNHPLATVSVFDSTTFTVKQSFRAQRPGLYDQTVSLRSLGHGKFVFLQLTTGDRVPFSALHIVDTRFLTGASGEFHPLSPVRIVDTRSGLGRGGHIGKVGPGETIVTKVNGLGGIPLSGVDTVVMNVTATDSTKGSYLTLWPAGSARPDVSNLNFTPDQTVPNLVTVPVNSEGEVALYNASGATHVLYDVAGYYSNVDGNRGDRFGSMPPARILDTRNGVGRPKGKVGDTAFDLRVTSPYWRTIPTAVVLNVTVTNPTEWSFLTVSPAGQPLPTVSNLNYVAGQTVPNQVIVKLSPTGAITLKNAFGTADVIIDLVGSYQPTGDYPNPSGRFVSFEPFRWFDSRSDTGIFGEDGKLEDGEGLIIGLDPTWIGAYVMNVTITGATGGGYVTAYPSNAQRPTASVANFAAGQTVANHVMMQGGPEVIFDVTGGPTHLIIDVFGAFIL